MRKIRLVLALLVWVSCSQEGGQNNAGDKTNHFAIVSKTATASIYRDTCEIISVEKSIEFLASDIEKVSGRRPAIIHSGDDLANKVTIVATLGNNCMID